MDSPVYKDSNPEEVDQLVAIGLDYFGMNRIEEAITTWEQVLKIDPKNQQANDYLDIARESEPRLKKHARTADVPRNVVAFFPEEPSSRARPKAPPVVHRKRPVYKTPHDESKRQPARVRSAEETQPIDVFAEVFKLGMKAYVQRDYPTAIVCFEKCIRIRPNDARVQHNLETLKKKRVP